MRPSTTRSNTRTNNSDGLDDQDMGVILGAATVDPVPVLRPEVQAWAEGDDD